MMQDNRYVMVDKEMQQKTNELQARANYIYYTVVFRKLLKKVRVRLMHVLIINAILFLLVIWVFDVLHTHTIEKI